MVWIALPIIFLLISFFVVTLYKGYKYEQEEEIKENLIETNEIDLDNVLSSLIKRKCNNWL